MSSYPRKRGRDEGSYVLRQDSLKVTTPNVTLEVNCPRGLDLDMARELITTASGLEFRLTKDVVGGRAFTNSGFPLGRDSSLPSNVIEFRDEAGQVLGRITNVGRITTKAADEDDED